MRSINLLKIAAEAEQLRIRSMMGRQIRRSILGAAALIFVLAVLVLAEATGWQALCFHVPPISATAILLGINLLIAIVLGMLAARSSPGQTEREALHVRQQALERARGALAFTAIFPAGSTLLRLALQRGGRRS